MSILITLLFMAHGMMKTMGKVKNLIFDIEDDFLEECNKHIGSCETFYEFQAKMEAHAFHELKHLTQHDIDDWMSEIWNEYWSKYQP